MNYRPVTAHTRARREGTVIKCPCGHRIRVYHFAWSAILCPSCNQSVDKYDWRARV